jgi:PEP-CTERM motif
MKIKSNKNLGFLSAALVSSLAIYGTSNAAVTFDLRATAKNALPIVGENTTKAVAITSGDVIELTMFVMVTGTGAGVEGFQSAIGKTITTHQNGASGNQGGAALLGSFTAGALPTNIDLNGDGFLDLGSTAATTTSGAGDFIPRFTTAGAFDETGTTITNGKEFALFKFTYTAVNFAAGTASIQYTQQLTTVINSSTAKIDGVSVLSKNIGLPSGANATALGAPVVLSALAVPEPTSFAMLMMGSLGLVGFRRPSFRRSA